MQQLIEQVKSVWSEMPSRRRMMTVGILGAVIVGFVALIATQSSSDWKPVAKASPEVLKSAVSSLEERGIPTRLTEDNVLQVPSEHVDVARLEVSMAGASSTTAGMELFNEPRFGSSRFWENVNLVRAKEGELARTLESMDGVKKARVHLSIPKRRLPWKKGADASASVMLTLDQDTDLDKKQTAGIRYLVSSGIQNLESTGVTILDHRGKVLAKPSSGDSPVVDTLHEQRESIESKLEARLEETLRPVIGFDQLSVMVTAELDFKQVELTEKTVDPDSSAITGEIVTVDNSTSNTAKAGGVPGTQSNMPGAVVAGKKADKGTTRLKKASKTSYNTGETLRRVIVPNGQLAKLNVSVMVGWRNEVDASGDTTQVPRSPEELKALEDLVRAAVGIDEKRGDQISVKSLQFESIAEVPAPVAEDHIKPWMKDAIRWGGILLLAVLLILGVIRPITKLAKVQPTTGLAIAGGGNVPMEDTVLESPSAGELPAPEAPRGEQLRMHAIELTRENPSRATQIIQTWLMVEK